MTSEERRLAFFRQKEEDRQERLDVDMKRGEYEIRRDVDNNIEAQHVYIDDPKSGIVDLMICLGEIAAQLARMNATLEKVLQQK